MGVNFLVYAGTNRATCTECRQKIKVNEAQVNGYAYQTSGNIHLSCLIKIAKEKNLKY